MGGASDLNRPASRLKTDVFRGRVFRDLSEGVNLVSR